MSQHPDLSQRSRGSVAGFTLVEVLVALTLLTTALVPAFTLASNAVALSTRIKNSLIAANLAQEGIESVRAIRDSNWFNPPRAFDEGLTGCSGGCTVQYDSTAVPVPGYAVADVLKLDPATGLYQYTDGAPTIFSRTVTISGATPKLKVVSEVFWKEHSTPRTMKLEYYLYDWIQ